MKKLLFLCIPFFLFSGCTSSEPSNSGQLQNLVHEQRKIENQQSAYFSLEKKEHNIYQIILHNPKKLAIQSLQFSLTYPDHLAEISDFKNLSDKLFPLVLKKQIANGLFSVSMGQNGKAVKLNEKIILGEFKEEKKSDSPFQLSFFNGEKGNSIMVVENNQIINVLNLGKLENVTVE